MSTNKSLPNIGELFAKYAIYFILAFMCIGISIFKPQFLSATNIVTVLSSACVYGCMALGLTFIIVSGGIDLSAGAIVAFSGVVGAVVGQTATATGKVLPWLPQMPFVVVIIVALLAGGVCGAINGTLIAKASTPPFIVTLGMTTVVRGFALLITGGEPVSNLQSGYTVIGGKFFDMIPVAVIIFIILIAISSVLLNRTRFGIDTYAIGSNAKAAVVSGVKVPKRLITIYIYAGIMYAIAGLIIAGRGASIHPGTADGYELTAIAAVVIGGASPSGGIGSIRSTIVGALIISVLRNGLTLLGIDSYWQQIAEGVIIVVAVVFAMRRKNTAK